MANHHPLSYERGVLDGLEIALRIHARHFDGIKPDRKDALRVVADTRRALARFRQDANDVLSAVQQHKMERVAGFFGYTDLWSRISQLRDLVPMPVELEDGSLDVEP